MRSRLEESYFDWLCDKVDYELHRDSKQLLLDLYLIDFYSLVPNDDNRAADGQALREQYGVEIDDIGIEEYLTGPCTLLEMLIALAGRMNFIASKPNSPDRTSEMFWILIDNLGLELISTGDPLVSSKRRRNKRAIQRLLDRDYLENGKGGLFPLTTPHHKDQRKTEIWYQMQAYMWNRWS